MRRSYLMTFLMILSITTICGAQNLLPQPNRKGLWGYVNEKGKYVIKPVYQAAEKFSSNLACVKINGLWGYVNSAGQFVITPAFDNAESFNGNYARCIKNGKYGIIDRSGATVIDFEFSEFGPSKNGKFHIARKNENGPVYVVGSDYSEIHNFDSVADVSKNGYYTVIKNGKFGFLSDNGKLVHAPDYLEEPVFSSSSIAVSHKESGYGIINKSLKSILPEKYSYIRQLKNGNYCYGKEESVFGLLSKSGSVIFEEGRYSSTKLLEDKGLIEAVKDAKMILLDVAGRVIVDECDKYELVGDVVAVTVGTTVTKMNLVSGAKAISVNGKDVWTSGMATSISFETPFVKWTDNFGRQHLMTPAGVPVFENYDNVSALGKGRYDVVKDEKHAIADASGNLLTEWIDAVMPIDGEYVQLVRNGSYRNTRCAILRLSNAKMITGWDFVWVYSPQSNGLIPVKLTRGDNLGRTDKKLKMAGDNFYIADDESEGMYAITDFKTKKMGVMNENGKIIVTPKYDEVGTFRCGMCRVWILDKGNGFINKSGVLVIPCKYPQALDFGQIEGVSNYTQVWDYYGDSYYIDKKGNIADPDKVMREAYGSQRQNSWY